MMSLQHRLPLELWTGIFQTLPNSSSWLQENAIKNVRLVCRLFERLATPFLLAHVRCGPLSRELTALTAVSLHPVLSRSVKEIIYVGSRYPMMRTFVEYKEALEASEFFDAPKSQEQALDLKSAFLQHGQYYNDQSAMETSGETVARLCTALMRMPNVDKITVSPNFYCYLDNHYSSKYFLEPKSAYDDAFLLMTLVLSLTGTNIRELDIEDDDAIPERAGVTGRVFRGMSTMSLGHCCNAFRDLRKISMEISEVDIYGWKTGYPAEIISCATNLEYLWLSGDGYDLIPVKYLLSTTVWSRLTSVSLIRLALDQEELVDFLRRHAGTLKDLWLFDVDLRSGSWDIVLERMKSLLSLQTVSIQEVIGRDNEGDMIDIYMTQAAVEDYLLGDGFHPLLVKE